MGLRIAARSLLRARVFTLTTIATLTLAASLAATVFAVVDGVLFKPLPYPQAERLFTALGTEDGTRMGAASFSMADIAHLAEADPRVMVVGFGGATSLRHPTSADAAIRAVRVAPSFFDVLGQRPLVGGFSSDDYQRPRTPAETESAIISHGVWRQWTGADPEAVGQTLDLVGRRIRIVGVLPESFLFPGAAAGVILPLVVPEAQRTDRWARTTSALVRMGEGISYEEGKARLDAALAARVSEYSPRNMKPGPYNAVFLRPLESALGSSERPLFRTAFIAASLLGVLGCINVAGLLAARGRDRERELAVRAALGAGRLDLARLLLAETFLLATVAGAGAVLLAKPMLAGVLRLMPDTFNLVKAPVIDWRVAAFALIAAVATQTLFALFPIATLLRADLVRRLGGGATSTPRARSWGRAILLATETAIGLSLIIGGSIVIAGYAGLRSEESGFANKGLTLIQMLTPGSSGPAAVELREAAMARIASIPAVEAVATVGAPMMDNMQAGSRFKMPPGARRMMVSDVPVSPSFYEVAGLRIIEGRLPTMEERISRAPIAVVSREAAEGYWPDHSAVGQVLESSDLAVTVVGVVSSVRLSALDEENAGEIFLPERPERSPLEVILVRTRRGESLEARDIALAINRDVPGVVVRRALSMDDAIAASIADHSFRAFVFAAAAGAALLLVAIGVAGLAATGVIRRTRELGIRSALGARASRLVRMVVADYLRGVVAGLAAGLLFSWWAAQAMRAFVYQLDVHHPGVWVAAVGTLLATCAVAAWIPARRAARVDPVLVLRSE